MGIFPGAFTRLRAILLTGLLTGAMFLLAACTLTPLERGTVPPPASDTASDEVIATLTYAEGEVFVQEPMAAVRAPGLLAQPVPQRTHPFRPLRQGATLQMGEGSRVTYVCHNDRVQGARGPGKMQVTHASCGSGQQLPQRSAQHVQPHQNGRLQEQNGSQVVESEQREGENDYGRIPVVIGPRNSALLLPAPDLTWVAVPDAIEYELSLSSLQPFEPLVLAAADVACAEDERVPFPLCTSPWPAGWTLEPGQRYFLTVAARTGIASPLRESEASALRTLPAEEAAAVQRDADAIRAIDALDPVTRGALLGGLYAGHELFHAAIAAYADALSAQPVAELAVAQGDLYLDVELYRLALDAYQRALALLDAAPAADPAGRAAAEFGIGLAHFARTDYAAAIPHLETAHDLYAELGATDARADVARALEAARERS
jgi:hypothetical protein